MNGLYKIAICLIFFSLFAMNVLGDSAFASALALKEIKSIEIPFNFTKNLMANENISFLLYINSTDFADRIEHIISMNLRITIDKRGGLSQSFNAIVNGTHCSNSPYTTMLNSAQYVINMLCINAINTTLFNTTYNLTFNTNRDTDNLLLTSYITYVNNPDFSDLGEHINFTKEIPLLTWNNSSIIKTTNITDFSLNQIVSETANSVWNFTSRTLTNFNFAVNLTTTALSDLANSVWNFGGSFPTLRNTTASNVNVSVSVNSTANITNSDIVKIVSLFCNLSELC